MQRDDQVISPPARRSPGEAGGTRRARLARLNDEVERLRDEVDELHAEAAMLEARASERGSHIHDLRAAIRLASAAQGILPPIGLRVVDGPGSAGGERGT